MFVLVPLITRQEEPHFDHVDTTLHSHPSCAGGRLFSTAGYELAVGGSNGDPATATRLDGPSADANSEAGVDKSGDVDEASLSLLLSIVMVLHAQLLLGAFQ
ncbi:hypothetical protein [Nocardia brasiliensis]|uniref:hypothetical protein n=1 Tax=Nocardia brasiliensis TaxID=37326 RepID=UPI0014355266|nr:hypothetical protein [Nocardia brasiliensis]